MRLIGYYKLVSSNLRSSWRDAKLIVEQKHKRTRLSAFLDLFLCFLFYGADYSNYVAFHFYDLNRKGRNRFITYYRNNKLWQLFSKSCRELFLDKARFNDEFKPFIFRKWVDTRKESEGIIKAFIVSQAGGG